MIGRILTVSGFTLVSRVSGFIRDMVLAAVLGAGPVADVFFVALRIPNHFRAIFAEGAFNAAFVPAYARVRAQGGGAGASLFADRIFTLLLVSQLVLLALALIFMPALIAVFTPGYVNDPQRFGLAVEFSRITFPYLLLITIVSFYGGILNALHRFAAAAAAPILFNISMITALALAVFFPSAGHAAAWAVLVAGILEALLLIGAAGRADVLAKLRWPSLDANVRAFFRALGPATVGSAGVQLALFADTMIAGFLPAGALSSLYYADRLNQLPIGVIGIAVGTVLLPEMATRLAAGDENGARKAQARAIELSLLLSLPCIAAFLAVPDLLMRALFMRGAFTAADASAAGATLAAYAIGLVPFVLIRSMTATFFARGDTATPVKAALAAVAVNIAFKIALMGPLAQVGLALATSIGAWINLALVIWLGRRAGLISFESGLKRSILMLAVAGIILAAALWFGLRGAGLVIPAGTFLRDEAILAALVIGGALCYVGTILLLLGMRWVKSLVRGVEGAAPTSLT